MLIKYVCMYVCIIHDEFFFHIPSQLYVHDGREPNTPSVAGPNAGAQKGSESSSSSIKTPLAIAIPLALIGES